MKKVIWIEKEYSYENRKFPKRFNIKQREIISNILNKLNKEVFEWRLNKNQYHSIVVRIKNYEPAKANTVNRVINKIEKELHNARWE